MDGASRFAWPVTQLGRALELVAHAGGLGPHSAMPPSSPPPPVQADSDALGRWVEQACRRLQLEAESTEVTYGDVEARVRHAGPALLMLPGSDSPSFLALVDAGRRSACLLGRDGRRQRVRMSELAAWLRQPVDVALAPAVRGLIAEAGIPAARQSRAGFAILHDQFASTPVASCWILRLPPRAPFWQQLRRALLIRHLLIFCLAYIAGACVSVTTWWIIGRAALEGRFDAGTLIAWTFLLLTLVPISLLVAWSQGVFAIGAGGLLKLRLLYGALRLEPDEIRHQGIGQHLARVMESESIESLMLAAGFSALAAGVDLLLAAVIFVAASQPIHLFLLVLTLLVTSGLGWRYFHRLQQWTDARLRMTDDLVERMVGHRTRLAQEPSSRWHDGEDQLLERYIVLSTRMDRTAVALLAVPRGWLLVGMIGFAPLFLAGQTTPGTLAVGLGAILLAFGAWGKLMVTFAYVAGAAVGWKQIKPLLDAARRPEINGCTDLAPAVSLTSSSRPGPLVIANDVAFQFPDRAKAALAGCSFQIAAGDRIHLSGPSGSGRSTLVSLLTGLRSPASGVLLVDGLDRATVGSRPGGGGWSLRRSSTRITSSPKASPSISSWAGAGRLAPQISSWRRISAAASSSVICWIECRAGCFNS